MSCCLFLTVPPQGHPRFYFFSKCHAIIVTTLIAYMLAILATVFIFAQLYELFRLSAASGRSLLNTKLSYALIILLILSWLICGSALYGVRKIRRVHLVPMMIATTLVLFVIVGVVTSHGVEAWLLTDEMDFMRFFYLFLAIVAFLACFLAYMYLFAAVFRSYEYLGKLRREIVMESYTYAKFVLLLLGILETTIGGLLIAGGVLAIVYLSWLNMVCHGIWGGVLIGFVGLVIIAAIIQKKSGLYLLHTMLGTILLLLVFPSITVLWALELDVNMWSSYGDPEWCQNGCDDDPGVHNRYYNLTNMTAAISNSLPGTGLGAWDKFRQAYLGQNFWPQHLGQNIWGLLNNEFNHGEIPCSSDFWQENCHKNMSAWVIGVICLCLSAVGAIVVLFSICLSCCTYANCFGGNHHNSSGNTRRRFTLFHSHHSPSVSPMPTEKVWHQAKAGPAPPPPPQYENIVSN